MFSSTKQLIGAGMTLAENGNTPKITPVQQIIQQFQEQSEILLSEVIYGENAKLMPQLIGRAANIAYINETQAKQSFDNLQTYKQLHKINDLGVSLENELALAIYVFTYNDSNKSEQIKTVLKELGLSGKNTQVPSMLQELCKYYALPLEKNPTPISNPLEK